MSKHDARISKTKYIISMVLAVLISLGAGIGSGYFIAKYKDVDTNSPKTVISKDNLGENNEADIKQGDELTQSENIDEKTGQENDIKPDEKETEEPEDVQTVVISKSEQTSIAKSVLNSFYDIDSKTYGKLLTDSEKKSNSTGKSQNTIFREELYNIYKKVMAENSLSNIKKIIYDGSLENYYFSDFFNGKRNTELKSVDISQYKDNTITSKSTVTNSFIYYSVPNSSDFFSKLKGKGLTKEQYIAMIMENPKRIRVKETRKDQFDLKQINNKWYIVNDKSEIYSTEIIEVIFEDKTYSLDEFKRKFL